jgi:flagellar protein FliS
MLYDGAIRFLEEAGNAMDARDMVTKARAVSKAMAIISELQGTLNLEAGGEVAAQLDALYMHFTTRIIEANVQRDRRPLDEVIALLRPLRDAWSQIASSTASAA